MDTFALTEGIVPEQNQQDYRSSGNLPEGAQKFQRAIAAWRGNKPGMKLWRPKYLLTHKLGFHRH